MCSKGSRDRLTFLPLGLNAQEPVISPDGKTLVFAGACGESAESLMRFPLDELSKEPQVAKRQPTSTPGRKSDYVFGPDSKRGFLSGERRGEVDCAGGADAGRRLQSRRRCRLIFDVEKKVVFEEVWETLNRRFYDAKFHDKDWLKLHDEWAPYIAGTRTSDELRRDINLLIGELNASHSGD